MSRMYEVWVTVRVRVPAEHPTDAQRLAAEEVLCALNASNVGRSLAAKIEQTETKER